MELQVCIVGTIMLFVSSTFAARSEKFSFMEEYFTRKRITQLHLLLCNENDGYYLRKQKSFSKFLSVVYVTREVDWDSFRTSPSGFYMDLTCEYNSHLFSQVSNRLLRAGFSWMLASPDNDTALTLLEKADIGLSTDLVLLLEDGKILEVYRTSSQGPLEMRDCGLEDSPPCLPLKTRFNLMGRPLRGSILNILDVSDDDKGKKQFSEKVTHISKGQRKEVFIRKYYILHQLLGREFNYSISLQLADNYGYITSNGSFNGIVRQLILNETDFGITPIIILPERLDVIDYAVSLEALQFIFVFLEPRSLGGVLALAMPFTMEVWLATITISALSVVASVIIFYMYLPGNIISEGILNVVGVVSAQGVQEMNVASSRVLNLFLLFLGLLLATYYNAAIMKGLLSPSPVNIKTVKDLMDAKTVGLANISYLNPLFYHPLLKKKVREHQKILVYDISEGIMGVKKHNLALAGDGKLVYGEMDLLLTDSEKCSARELPMQHKAALPLSPVVQKHSHYQEMFKQGFIALEETGVARRESKFWYPGPPHCLGGTVFVPVGLKAVTIAYGIFIIGILIAVIIFIFELRHKGQPKVTKVMMVAFRK